MNDTISRSKTLDAFAEYVGGGMSMNDFDALWEIVEKMPPAREWIPVSERLPENNKNVLATDGLDVFIAWHNPEKEEWFSFDELFDEQYPILAWQPLPEPYKGEREDEK